MVVSPRGGIVMELHAPDREGAFEDVVLGFERIEDYGDDSPYFGALVGRFGNRIGGAAFWLDGKRFDLAANNGPNHLHGGLVGFDKAVWETEPFKGEGFEGLRLRYRSADMEEGYPGNLDTEVVYRLTEDNEWIIEYEAITDAPTVVNLTQHSYFNLAGHGSGDILGHEARIEADLFTPVDDGQIPTGEILPVAGTPFDLRQGKRIGEAMEGDDEQLELGGGFDHNFALRKRPGELAKAAEVYEPGSGRLMEVWTTEPGVQFYTGNSLDGSLTGKGGAVYGRRTGLCLETQRFPDSPNKAMFPSARLDPGQVYRSKTVYRFGTR